MTQPSTICVGALRRPSATDPSPQPCFEGAFPSVGTLVMARTSDLDPAHAAQWAAEPSPDFPRGLQPFGIVRDADSYGPSLHYQGVWQEGAPLYVAVSRETAERHLLDLVDRYWDLAHIEGREGRTHDTPDGAAQRTRRLIEETLRRLR